MKENELRSIPLRLDMSRWDTNTVREWNRKGPHGALTNARNYAKDHGSAVSVDCRGMGTLFYRDPENGKVRQRSIGKCTMASTWIEERTRDQQPVHWQSHFGPFPSGV